jgi:hypothetical protein
MGNIFWDSKGILSDLFVRFVRFVVKLRIAAFSRTLLDRNRKKRHFMIKALTETSTL